MDKIITLKYLISGRVQGVGFRWFTKRIADELNIAGYVRNLLDGRVEAVAQARKEDFHDFRNRLEKGPDHAEVTSIEESEVTVAQDFQSFEITY